MSWFNSFTQDIYQWKYGRTEQNPFPYYPGKLFSPLICQQRQKKSLYCHIFNLLLNFLHNLTVLCVTVFVLSTEQNFPCYIDRVISVGHWKQEGDQSVSCGHIIDHHLRESIKEEINPRSKKKKKNLSPQSETKRIGEKHYN